MRDADAATGDMMSDADGAWANSPIAQLLVEGDFVVVANGAARALLGAVDGTGLSTALSSAPLGVRLTEGLPDARGRRVVALHVMQSTVEVASAGRVGEAFLEWMLAELTARTGACLAFVGELDTGADGKRVDAGPVCEDGIIIDGFDYALGDAPCSGVFDGRTLLIADGVAARYPADVGLARRGIAGYAGVPLMLEDGRVLGIVVLLFRTPITNGEAVLGALQSWAPRAAAELQRVRFERRLAQSELRYRELVESSDDGLIVIRARRIVYGNPAAARILGFESPDALCSIEDVADLVSVEDQPLVQRQIATRLSGARADNLFELGAQHRDGHVVPVQVSASDLEWEGAPALQVLFVDLSARKQRQERVQLADRMASLGKLTGGIAHDFNNLLAVILGNIEMIARDSDERMERPVRQARIAAQRGAELTERLLTFARRQALRPQAVAPDTLLEETRALLAPVLGEDIELRIRAQCRDPIEVDPSQLQAALINLAVNARDAMASGGCVDLRTFAVSVAQMRERFPEAEIDALGAHVCIEVEDDGPGMSAEVAAQAFEPFFTTKGASKGTGLGLSMVHGFVTQSRGRIELDSAPGGGTRIRLFLPCSDASTEAPAPKPPSPRRQAPASQVAQNRFGDGLDALVIEDEASVREVAVAMLEGLGFNVAQAADGPSGREILGRERFHLLLSDVVLPGGQRGPDIAADALARDPSMTVLFMSGYAETSDFQKYRLRHDFRLIRKPFRFDQLRGEVDAVLSARGDP